MLGQELLFFLRCHPAWRSLAHFRTTIRHFLFTKKCSLRLPYSATMAFPFALGSPFRFLFSAAIPPPATLWVRRNKAYSSSSSVFSTITHSKPNVKFFYNFFKIFFSTENSLFFRYYSITMSFIACPSRVGCHLSARVTLFLPPMNLICFTFSQNEKA